MTVSENQDGDCEEELDGLKDVDNMAGPFTVDTEESIGISLHGVAIGVEVQEDFVELETGVHGETTEDSVERNTRAIAHLSECPSARVC